MIPGRVEGGEVEMHAGRGLVRSLDFILTG